MTSELRTRLRSAPVVEERPPSLSASVSSGFAVANAGIKPNKIPVPTATIAVTIKTTRSTFTSASRGTVRAPICLSSCRPQTERMIPAAAPAIASNTLSVSIWRSNRQRPAPRATRIASSRSRALALASSMVARFAHAISSTKITAPSKIARPVRIPPTT